MTRSEAEQDRIAALAHFAAGRTLQQRGDFAGALRHYARADRLDPASRTARNALVAFAVEQKRLRLPPGMPSRASIRRRSAKRP